MPYLRGFRVSGLEGCNPEPLWEDLESRTPQHWEPLMWVKGFGFKFGVYGLGMYKAGRLNLGIPHLGLGLRVSGFSE